MDARIQHENEPLQGLPAIIWHAKDFAAARVVAAGAWEIYRRSYDGLRCPEEWLEPNLNISFIVFPSAVNFGLTSA